MLRPLLLLRGEYRTSMEIRKAAVEAVVELDHSEKWAQAIKFPSRNEPPTFFVPGSQCFLYSAAERKNRKGGQSRSTPGNWHGPAVVIGIELDKDQQKESFWIRYNGRFRLVSSENLRYATMEEVMSREEVVE